MSTRFVSGSRVVGAAGLERSSDWKLRDRASVSSAGHHQRRRRRSRAGLVVPLALAFVGLTWSGRVGTVPSAGASSVVVAVAAGYVDACALTATGGVKCWGANVVGQIGDGTFNERSAPVDVVGLGSGVTAVTTIGNDSCALTSVGGVKCWGNNTDGALGNGARTGPQTCPMTTYCSTVPVDVVGLASGVSAISGSCALTTSGGVKCWGQNDGGQLGDGTSTGPELCQNNSVPCSTTPVDVVGLTSGVKAISSDGVNFACALTTGGGVKCWGMNDNGELGDGTSTGPETCSFKNACSTTPVDVVGLTSGVKAISSGENQSCALLNTGSVKCWGGNNWGQLGDGTSTGPETNCSLHACSTVPVDVTGLTSGISAVATGSFASCALTMAGAVKCWGLNFTGQLGDGTSTGPQSCPSPCSTTPVDVSGLSSGAVAITVGTDPSCALTTTEVKCWGGNWSGQLGIGTNTGPEQCGTFNDLACSTTPVAVPGLTASSPHPPNIFEVEVKLCKNLHVGYNYFPANTVVHWNLSQA